MTVLYIGIRIHVPNEPLHQKYYLDNMLHWLQYRGFNIQKYTAGIHLATENPHIHIHAVTEGKPLSNPIATFKRDYEFNKLPQILGTGDYPDYPENVHKGMYGKRINISIQMTQPEEGDDPTRFLQYPLKENHILQCQPLELEELAESANREYKESCAKHEAEEAKKAYKEQKEKSEWFKFTTYLDEQNCNSLEMTFTHALKYYRDNYDKVPTGKLIFDNSERYCIKNRIISDDELIAKYIGRY